MGNFSRAKSATEQKGTEKLRKFHSSVRLFILGFTAIVLLGASVYFWERTAPQRQQAQQQAQQLRRTESKPTLSMPPYGKSAHITPPAGHATTFTGSGFTTHCVYSDGTEGVVGDLVHPCGNGPMLYQFVQDTTGRANAVTYEFVRP